MRRLLPALLLAAACASPAATHPATAVPRTLTAPTPSPNASPSPVADPPPAGLADPAVTQATIAATICTAGYTATVRPPSSYTTPLKVTQMAALGLPGTTRDYEEDHLIPLEVGGSPRDPANLWPEPIVDARVKDRAENRAHTAVCAGRLDLERAQDYFEAGDWKDIP